MRKITPLVLFFLFIFSAYSSDEEITPPILNINQDASEINISHNTTTAKIVVESNIDWQASFKEEVNFASFEETELIHKIEGKQDNEVLIFFSKNTETNSRNTTVRFTARDGLSKEVTITQEGQSPT